ncbi:MAG TPA: hypothetical protein VGJ94_15650 [Syntrophorhabdaceae bacterium]
MKIDTWRIGKVGAVLFLICATVLSLVTAGVAQTGAQVAEEFLNKKPITSFDATMTLDQARKAQGEFIAAISKELGEPVGYKAGLTNPNMQKMLGVSEPIRGTLLQKMLLPNGAVVSADFGAIPVAEGDLIVRVGDEAINEAKTPVETLKYLDAVIPFIELPDMVFGKGVKLTAPAIVAINVGARYGILGNPIALATTPEWQERLKNFTFQMFDEKGVMVAEGKGTALLGGPLNAAFWIKQSLAAEGKRLKRGDLLSLGSLTRPIPAKQGAALRAKYLGLDPKGPVEVSVSFK